MYKSLEQVIDVETSRRPASHRAPGLRALKGFGPPESAASSPGGRDLRGALSRGCLNEGSQKSLQKTAFYTLLGQVGTRDPRAVSASAGGQAGRWGIQTIAR